MFDLRLARLDRGLSLRAAAKQIGIRHQILHAAEQGSEPHPANQLRIAIYYGKRPSEIWAMDKVAA